MNIIIVFIIGAVILVAFGLIYSRKSESQQKKSDNPLEEAESYLLYGRKKQAVDVLEKYLLINPDDDTAIRLLAKAKE